MSKEISRRQMLGGGAATAALVSVGAPSLASGDAPVASDSATAVVAEVDGGRARVAREDGTVDDTWWPVASNVLLRAGDVVEVGRVDVGAPEVVSPRYQAVTGRVEAVDKDWVIIGGRRCEVAAGGVARTPHSRGAGGERLDTALRAGSSVQALCIVNRGDGSSRIAAAYTG